MNFLPKLFLGFLCLTVATAQCAGGKFGYGCQFDTCTSVRGLMPGLKAEYYSSASPPVYTFVATEPIVNFDWSLDAPKPGLPANNFRIIYSGFVRPNITGSYKFIPNCGGNPCHLYIENVKVLEKDQLYNLTASMNFRLKFVVENIADFASAVLAWVKPGDNASSVLPADYLMHDNVCPGGCNGNGCCSMDGNCACYPGWTGVNCEVNILSCTGGSASLVSGLQADFFPLNNATLVYRRRDNNVSFDWSLDTPANFPRFFHGVWSGFIEAPATGWYNIITRADDGLRIFLDSVLLILFSGRASQPVFLQSAVKYSIVIEFFNTGDFSNIDLRWSSESFNSTLITGSSLTSYANFNDCSSCPIGSNGEVCSGSLRSYGCFNNMCICLGAYYGPDCSKRSCLSESCVFTDSCYLTTTPKSECGGRGTCDDGQCVCTSGYSVASDCFGVNECPGNGQCSGNICSNNQCNCNPAKFGDDCQFDVCGAYYARMPGLRAEYWSSASPSVFAYAVPERTIDYDWSLGSPNAALPANNFRVVYSGFIRPYVAGVYKISCQDATCSIWIDGVLSTPTNNNFTFVPNQNYRLKMKIEHVSDFASARLLWRPPGELKDSIIPSLYLLHENSCPQGCNNRGCCTGDGKCTCDPGWTGANCSISMSSCVENAMIKTGGLQAKFFDLNKSPEISLLERVDRVVDFDWSLGSFAPNMPRFWQTRWSGYLHSDYTGWHTIRVRADDGVRVYLDRVVLIPFGGRTQNVFLIARRRYAFELDYRQASDFGNIRLEWGSDFFMMQLIAPEYLSSLGQENCTNRCPLGKNNEVCSGNQHSFGCISGMCVCFGYYQGSACELNSCPSVSCLNSDLCYSSTNDRSECAGVAVCGDGVCECPSNVSVVSDCFLEKKCKGNGLCSSSSSISDGNNNSNICISGVCVCNDNRFGEDCEYDICNPSYTRRPGLSTSYYSRGPPLTLLLKQVEPNADFDFSLGAAKPGLPANNFRIIYSGFIRVYESGKYNFSCPADDMCSVWVDGKMALSNRSFDLVSNTFYTYLAQYDEGDDFARVSLRWVRPGDSVSSVIPKEAFSHENRCTVPCKNGGCCDGDDHCHCQPGWTGIDCSVSMLPCLPVPPEISGHGLHARFFARDGRREGPLYESVSPFIAFDWSLGAPPGVPNNFAGWWGGFLMSNFTGWHVIRVNVAGSLRVFLDKTLLIDMGNPAQSVYLIKGWMYELELNFVDGDFAAVYLYWSSDFFSNQIIPTESLFTLSSSDRCSCPHDSADRLCGGPNGFGCANGVCVCRPNSACYDCSAAAGTTSCPSRPISGCAGALRLGSSLANKNLSVSLCANDVLNNLPPRPPDAISALVEIVIRDFNNSEIMVVNLSSDQLISIDIPVVEQGVASLNKCKEFVACQWFNQSSRVWSTSGCELVQGANGQGTCQCTHLTLFAMVIERANAALAGCVFVGPHPEPFYAFFALYACMFIAASVQAGRLTRVGKVKEQIFVQHVVVVFIALLRGAVCGLLMVRSSPLDAVGILLLGMGPVFLEYCVFGVTAAVWGRLALYAMDKDAQKKFDYIIVAVLCVCFLITVAFPLSLLAYDDTTEGLIAQVSLSRTGSFTLGGLAMVVSAVFAVFGNLLLRQLSKGAQKLDTSKALMARRIRISVVSISLAFFLHATLWVVSVTDEILNDEFLNTVVTCLYYGVDCLLLLALMLLLAKGVSRFANESSSSSNLGRMSSQQRSDNSSSNQLSRMSSRNQGSASNFSR